MASLPSHMNGHRETVIIQPNSSKHPLVTLLVLVLVVIAIPLGILRYVQTHQGAQHTRLQHYQLHLASDYDQGPGVMAHDKKKEKGGYDYDDNNNNNNNNLQEEKGEAWVEEKRKKIFEMNDIEDFQPLFISLLEDLHEQAAVEKPGKKEKGEEEDEEEEQEEKGDRGFSNSGFGFGVFSESAVKRVISLVQRHTLQQKEIQKRIADGYIQGLGEICSPDTRRYKPESLSSQGEAKEEEEEEEERGGGEWGEQKQKQEDQLSEKEVWRILDDKWRRLYETLQVAPSVVTPGDINRGRIQDLLREQDEEGGEARRRATGASDRTKRDTDMEEGASSYQSFLRNPPLVKFNAGNASSSSSGQSSTIIGHLNDIRFQVTDWCMFVKQHVMLRKRMITRMQYTQTQEQLRLVRDVLMPRAIHGYIVEDAQMPILRYHAGAEILRLLKLRGIVEKAEREVNEGSIEDVTIGQSQPMRGIRLFRDRVLEIDRAQKLWDRLLKEAEDSEEDANPKEEVEEQLEVEEVDEGPNTGAQIDDGESGSSHSTATHHKSSSGSVWQMALLVSYGMSKFVEGIIPRSSLSQQRHYQQRLASASCGPSLKEFHKFVLSAPWVMPLHTHVRLHYPFYWLTRFWGDHIDSLNHCVWTKDFDDARVDNDVVAGTKSSISSPVNNEVFFSSFNTGVPGVHLLREDLSIFNGHGEGWIRNHIDHRTFALQPPPVVLDAIHGLGSKVKEDEDRYNQQTNETLTKLAGGDFKSNWDMTWQFTQSLFSPLFASKHPERGVSGYEGSTTSHSQAHVSNSSRAFTRPAHVIPVLYSLYRDVELGYRGILRASDELWHEEITPSVVNWFRHYHQEEAMRTEEHNSEEYTDTSLTLLEMELKKLISAIRPSKLVPLLGLQLRSRWMNAFAEHLDEQYLKESEVSSEKRASSPPRTHIGDYAGKFPEFFHLAVEKFHELLTNFPQTMGLKDMAFIPSIFKMPDVSEKDVHLEDSDPYRNVEDKVENDWSSRDEKESPGVGNPSNINLEFPTLGDDMGEIESAGLYGTSNPHIEGESISEEDSDVNILLTDPALEDILLRDAIVEQSDHQDGTIQQRNSQEGRKRRSLSDSPSVKTSVDGESDDDKDILDVSDDLAVLRYARRDPSRVFDAVCEGIRHTLRELLMTLPGVNGPETYRAARNALLVNGRLERLNSHVMTHGIRRKYEKELAEMKRQLFAGDDVEEKFSAKNSSSNSNGGASGGKGTSGAEDQSHLSDLVPVLELLAFHEMLVIPFSQPSRSQSFMFPDIRTPFPFDDITEDRDFVMSTNRHKPRPPVDDSAEMKLRIEDDALLQATVRESLVHAQRLVESKDAPLDEEALNEAQSSSKSFMVAILRRPKVTIKSPFMKPSLSHFHPLWMFLNQMGLFSSPGGNTLHISAGTSQDPGQPDYSSSILAMTALPSSFSGDVLSTLLPNPLPLLDNICTAHHKHALARTGTGHGSHLAQMKAVNEELRGILKSRDNSRGDVFRVVAKALTVLAVEKAFKTFDCRRISDEEELEEEEDMIYVSFRSFNKTNLGILTISSTHNY
eukprot:Nk52_evm12s2377 gene=Nk52_evmTU12s2377